MRPSFLGCPPKSVRKSSMVQRNRFTDLPIDVQREFCVRSSPCTLEVTPGLEIIYSFFERCMVQKHLEQMQTEGKIQFGEGKFLLNQSPGYPQTLFRMLLTHFNFIEMR